MPNPLIARMAEALRLTAPFQQSLPVTNRPQDALWHAHNKTMLALRLPLYHEALRKPRPKPKAYDDAIQACLALLASFAQVTGTRQAIARIEDGRRRAISFQPRPFGANWTAEHAISPVALRDDLTDPLLRHDDGAWDEPDGLAVPTRAILHLAGKTALAVMLSTGDKRGTGMATFVFDNGSLRPKVRAIWRPAAANTPSRVVELNQPREM